MSMNVFIFAEREITFKKKDGRSASEIQTVKFNAWQTPTSDTHMILASEDPIKAYIDWILAERSWDDEVPLFADDDVFCDCPIGKETVNHGKAHVVELRDWIARVEEDGFTVKVEMI